MNSKYRKAGKTTSTGKQRMVLAFHISLNSGPHNPILCFCYCLKELNSDLKVATQKVEIQSVKRSSLLNYWVWFQKRAFCSSRNLFWSLKSVQAAAQMRMKEPVKPAKTQLDREQPACQLEMRLINWISLLPLDDQICT